MGLTIVTMLMMIGLVPSSADRWYISITVIIIINHQIMNSFVMMMMMMMMMIGTGLTLVTMLMMIGGTIIY
jgi:hypothetical protein